MLQLFYKTSAITSIEWDKAYSKIQSIAHNFPLKLIRVESYNGYSPNLDKDHFDLEENIGTPEECLSFYGDWLSYTMGTTIRFYKNWDNYVAKELIGKEEDTNKPITWYPHYPFRNNGTPTKANGLSTKYGYIDARHAAYEYAIIAIAIMLENLLPHKVFLIASKIPLENINDVVNWLETHFNEPFELPIYFDKIRLLNSFRNEYTDKMHVVCRMEHLFRNQYKRNMEFAIKEIGYQPSFECYSDILSSNRFGTFGFSDVLDPWIAVTQDLESTLELISTSKKLTLEREGKKEAKEYDLRYILKDLLGNFILWTPQQREELAHFYTNKTALETGEESLWGMLYRMTGNRVDICPMYANQEELFEAFMYHEPKKGEIFKTIIDEWILKNADAFTDFKQKLREMEHQNEERIYDEKNDDENNDDENWKKEIERKSFVSQFPKHEQPFIDLAVELNPIIMNIESGVHKLMQELEEFIVMTKNQKDLKLIFTDSKKKNIQFIKYCIKKSGYSIHPNFEQWLNDENNKTVLFYLTLIISLKLNDQESAYIRYRILYDKKYWKVWEGVNLKIKN